MAIGSRTTTVTPITGSKLYWAICIPSSQVMDLKRETMDITEAYQTEIAKSIQGLPNHARNIGVCAALGWLPI